MITKTFSVQYVHVIERTVVATVTASTEGEAIQKVRDGEYDDDDSEFAPEEGIITKDYKIVG